MKIPKSVMQDAMACTNRSERCLRNWFNAGCDLANKSDLRKWMAKSVKGKQRARTMILRKSAGLNGQAHPASEDVREESELEGSPAALKRLERLEKMFFDKLMKSDPDRPDLANFNLTNYRGVVESLRKLEREVAVARRDTSQLIPRKQAIEGVTALAVFLRIAIMKWIGANLPDLLKEPDARSAKAFFLRTLAESVELTLTDGLGAAVPVPPWSLDIIRAELARG
jgi:hypothetical protein